MEAPKQHCGNRHYTTQPCDICSPPKRARVIDGEARVVEPKRQPKLPAPTIVTPPATVSTDTGFSVSAKRGRDRERYNAYQRSYQAKRRADDRALIAKARAAGLTK